MTAPPPAPSAPEVPVERVPGRPAEPRSGLRSSSPATHLDSVREVVREKVAEKVAEVKPKLRGWLHAGITPLALASGVVLIVLSPDAKTRVGSSVFVASALLLFAVSATYHRGNWSTRTTAVLRRFDHANIFLLIAGSYTPFTLVLLHGQARVVMLVVVWTGALLGVASKVITPNAPRWVSTPIYIALGWAAIFYAHDFVSGGPAVTTLVVTGGVLYTIGGVVFGLRRPDPYPTWFGFHEVFHLLTIAAFVCHYTAASIATYRLR